MSTQRQGVRLFGVPLDQSSQMGQSSVNDPLFLTDPLELSLGFPPRDPMNFEAGSSSRGWRTQVINPESGEFALTELYDFNLVEPPAPTVYNEPEPPAPTVYNEPEGDLSNSLMPVAPIEVGLPQGFASQGPIDVVELSSDDEADEDDVVVVSPRAVVQAGAYQTNQERTSLTDSESPDNNQRNQRRRVDSQPPVNIRDVEISSPPRRQLTYDCPVCYEPYVKATVTRCGHVFCRQCIATAIAVNDSCPTCREMLTPVDIMRIYLSEPQ